MPPPLRIQSRNRDIAGCHCLASTIEAADVERIKVETCRLCAVDWDVWHTAATSVDIVGFRLRDDDFVVAERLDVGVEVDAGEIEPFVGNGDQLSDSRALKIVKLLGMSIH